MRFPIENLNGLNDNEIRVRIRIISRQIYKLEKERDFLNGDCPALSSQYDFLINRRKHVVRYYEDALNSR